MRGRALIVFLALTGAALAGVLSASRPAVATRDSRAAIAGFLPDYPGAAWMDMGGPVHVEGQPRRLGYFTTHDSAHKVADRFAGTFRAQGFAVRERQVGAERWVTASAPGEPLVRTVVATPSSPGTLVVGSATEPLAPAAPSRLPLPDGCHVVSRTGAKDALVTEMVVAYCPTTASAVATFFERRFGPGRRLRQGTTSYTKDTLELLVTLSENPSSKTPETLLTLTAQEPR